MTQVQQLTFHVTSAEHTRAIGEALAAKLRAGDIIMLNGPLGAGKTTLTQGIGQGLHVRGHVTSPTFTVSRIHPPLTEGGLALVHADAYRITDLDDLETVDLDSTARDTVTVIEWGEGKTEQLSEDRLEIIIERAEGTAQPSTPAPASAASDVVDLENIDSGEHTLTFILHGTRWDGVFDDLDSAARALAGLSGTTAHHEAHTEANATPTGAPTTDTHKE